MTLTLQHPTYRLRLVRCFTAQRFSPCGFYTLRAPLHAALPIGSEAFSPYITVTDLISDGRAELLLRGSDTTPAPSTLWTVRSDGSTLGTFAVNDLGPGLPMCSSGNCGSLVNDIVSGNPSQRAEMSFTLKIDGLDQLASGLPTSLPLRLAFPTGQLRTNTPNLERPYVHANPGNKRELTPPSPTPTPTPTPTPNRKP